MTRNAHQSQPVLAGQTSRTVPGTTTFDHSTINKLDDNSGDCCGIMNATVHQEHTSDSKADEKYWRMKYEQLKSDYDHLQGVNQNLEEKLLNVVESFSKKKDELIANIEYEKSTLMADVNKLSTKLVDARIKLHDYEEKEILHAAECNSPCHRGVNTRQSGAEVPLLSSINRQQVDIVNIKPSDDKANVTGIPKRTTQIEHQQMIDDPNLV